MSDEKINLNNLTVERSGLTGFYFVRDEKQGQTLSKGYKHSTSCYAALGRIVSRLNKAERIMEKADK